MDRTRAMSEEFEKWFAEHGDIVGDDGHAQRAAWNAALSAAEAKMPNEHGDSDWENQRNEAIREAIEALRSLRSKE